MTKAGSRAPGPDGVSAALARLVEHGEYAAALGELYAAAQAIIEPLDRAEVVAEREIAAMKRGIIRSILDIARPDLSSSERWYYSADAIAVHREGGKVYVVARAGDAHFPNDGDDPADLLQLVILDDPGEAM